MNYKLLIKYDGTKYNGWQKQGNTENTIQGKIEGVLGRFFDESIEISGSGRTDAGVHAQCQVANFKTDKVCDVDELKGCLNKYLPEDIAVTNVEKAADRFHSRLSAVSKTYLYRIYVGTDKPVFDRRYVAELKEGEMLDVLLMEKAASYLIGKHDFKAFCGNKHIKKSTVREIYSIKILKRNDELDIYYTGNGFLQNMVRIITGTLIEVGLHERTAESMADILNSKNRENAGRTALAKGLTLLEVKY